MTDWACNVVNSYREPRFFVWSTISRRSAACLLDVMRQFIWIIFSNLCIQFLSVDAGTDYSDRQSNIPLKSSINFLLCD